MTRREREETKKRETEKLPAFAAKVAKILDIPQTAIIGTAQLQVMSNREAIIDGSQGVLEYSEECIRVNVGKMIIVFTGRGLSLKCMTGESLILDGYIMKIEFVA